MVYIVVWIQPEIRCNLYQLFDDQISKGCIACGVQSGFRFATRQFIVEHLALVQFNVRVVRLNAFRSIKLYFCLRPNFVIMIIPGYKGHIARRAFNELDSKISEFVMPKIAFNKDYEIG